MTSGGRSTILPKNKTSMCASIGAPLRLRWNSRPRDAHVLLVFALRVPDVARKESGKPGCAQAKNLVLRRQPRGPRSCLKLPLLLKASQLRPPDACLRVSQCVPIDRLAVGAILGKPPPTRGREAPRSSVGNVRCRQGHLKLQVFSSGQALLPVSWVVAISQKTILS